MVVVVVVALCVGVGVVAVEHDDYVVNSLFCRLLFFLLFVVVCCVLSLRVLPKSALSSWMVQPNHLVLRSS